MIYHAAFSLFHHAGHVIRCTSSSPDEFPRPRVPSWWTVYFTCSFCCTVFLRVFTRAPSRQDGPSTCVDPTRSFGLFSHLPARLRHVLVRMRRWRKDRGATTPTVVGQGGDVECIPITPTCDPGGKEDGKGMDPVSYPCESGKPKGKQRWSSISVDPHTTRMGKTKRPMEESDPCPPRNPPTNYERRRRNTPVGEPRSRETPKKRK